MVAGAAAAVMWMVPWELFPSDAQAFFVNVRLPAGTALERTDEVTARLDACLGEMPRNEVKSRNTTVGFVYDSNYQPHIASNVAQFFVTLADTRDPDPARRRTADAESLRHKVRDLVDARRVRDGLPVEALEVMPLNDGPPIGRPLNVRVKGRDWQTVRAAATEVQEFVIGLRGAKDVQSDFLYGNPEVRARLRPAEAARHGLSEQVVAAALAEANLGAVVSDFDDGDHTVDVRVLYRPEDRATVADLARVKVRSATAKGSLLDLGDVADLAITRSDAAVRRFNSALAVTITGDLDPAFPDATALTVNRAVQDHFHDLGAKFPGVYLDFAGEYEETERSFRSLGLSFIVAIAAVYMILGAQFKSFVQPLIILFTVPFSFIGVAIGLLITGNPFTITSGIAVVGLSGLVVNDSIVLLDFVNARRRREPGVDIALALAEGCRDRMRAIILTTITTVAGLLPTALGVGGKSKLWGPMATGIVFGLSAATLLTLFVIPTIYLIVERWRVRLFGRRDRPGARRALTAVLTPDP